MNRISHIILIGLCSLLFPLFSFSQWIDISPGTTLDFEVMDWGSDDFGAVVMKKDGNRDFEFLLATRDGGTSWDTLLWEDQHQQLILTVDAISDSAMGVVVLQGTVSQTLFLVTEDQGMSWDTVHDFANLVPWRNVHFCSPTEMVMAANGVGLAFSVDGGTNWRSQYPYQFTDYYEFGGIDCAAPQIAFMAGRHVTSPNPSLPNSHEVFMDRTTDGGLTWSRFETFSDWEKTPGKVQALSPDRVVVQKRATTADGNLIKIIGDLDKIMYYWGGSDVIDYHFLDENQGFVLTSDGLIRSTPDWGGSWNTEYTATSGRMNVIMKGGNSMFACGDNGELVKKTALVGLEEGEVAGLGVQVFPNPSERGFSLLVSPETKGSWEMWSVQGQQLQTGAWEIGNRVVTPQLKEPARGVYLIRVIAGNQQQTLRWVKE